MEIIHANHFIILYTIGVVYPPVPVPVRVVFVVRLRRHHMPVALVTMWVRRAVGRVAHQRFELAYRPVPRRVV